MPGAVHEMNGDAKAVRKLVLCFDGTGNTFSGSSGDTNIVKLYDKFNRDDPLQYHYYQTGIGTYDVNGGSVNKGIIGSIRSAVSRTLDQGIGTSFDHHVMAGYKFLMNHYNAGVKTDADPTGIMTEDKIYMFGFSRGAYTARFLARMINTVGLLSGGNDEMIPFAYQLYQRYEQGDFEPPSQKHGLVTRVESGLKDGLKNGVDTVRERFIGNEFASSSLSDAPTVNTQAAAEVATWTDAPTPQPANAQTARVMHELTAFKNTFCRAVKVYFLGIFDCVNSVAVLENPREPATVLGTAQHVRHAVAVDEFRVKFKPALLHQDVNAHTNTGETIKEVWFPGNHGDVGGGWPIVTPPRTFWGRMKKYWSGDVQEPGTSADPRTDNFQMSDIPLDWMIQELELVNASSHDKWAITFGPRKDGFRGALRRAERLTQAREGTLHDTMRFGRGVGLFKVILWNIMEYLPIISRYELSREGKWVKRRFPLNRGSARDIPQNAILHQSVIDRISHKTLEYRPCNNNGDGTPACLLNSAGSGCATLSVVNEQKGQKEDELHRVWTFHTT